MARLAEYGILLALLLLFVNGSYLTSDYEYTIKEIQPIPEETGTAGDKHSGPAEVILCGEVNGSLDCMVVFVESTSVEAALSGTHTDADKMKYHQLFRFLIQEIQVNTIEEWVQELAEAFQASFPLHEEMIIIFISMIVVMIMGSAKLPRAKWFP